MILSKGDFTIIRVDRYDRFRSFTHYELVKKNSTDEDYNRIFYQN